MRRLFTLLISLLISSGIFSRDLNSGDSTYKYFHDFQLGITVAFTEIGPFPLAELSTSHGICFTNRFWAGVGVSTIYFMTVTPYFIGRVNFIAKEKPSKNIPWFALKVGYMVYFDTGESDYNSINIEPRLGLSHLRRNGKSSWSFFISANAFQGRVFPKMGVGFEF